MLAIHRREVLARLEYEEIMRQSAVTPEETSKYYAAHHSDFEEAEVNQVVVRKKAAGAKEGIPGFTAEDAKTRAEEIRKALTSGEDPKKVAEKYQLPNVVRVDSKPQTVRRGQMRPDMEKAAFELKPGQVSEVFDLGGVLAFVQVVSHKMEEFKDVSPGIESTLKQQKINSALDALKKKANVWMDEGYFAPPSRPQQQGGNIPPVVLGAPTTPK
jgi:parvulin-like peptidyl-prolyl isomerase